MWRAHRLHSIIVAMGFSIALASAAQAAVGDGYEMAMVIAFTGFTNEVALSNFPALVVLSNGTAGIFDYSQIQSPPYHDLRFCDELGTELSYEIDSWDPGDESYVWVKVPLLYSGAVITCYWGKAGVESPECTSNGATWTEGYMSVHHLGTNYTDGSWVLDSAANWGGGDYGEKGDLVNAGTPYYGDSDWQLGKIGTCIALNTDEGEASEYISLVDGYTSFADGLTFSVWVNEKSVAGPGVWQPFIDLDDVGDYMVLYDSEGYIDFYTWANEEYGWPDDYTAGQWYNTVVTLTTSGEFTAYQNGELWWSSTGLTFPSSHVRSGNYLGWTELWWEHMPGKLDEVRISSVARSPEWVKASYDNQNDPASFAVYTAQFTTPGKPVIGNRPAVMSVPPSPRPWATCSPPGARPRR